MAANPERKLYLQQFKAISNAISTYEDLNLLIYHLIEGLCRTFEFKASSILLHDEREKQLFHVSSHGISEDYIDKGPVFYNEKHSAFVTGEPVFVDDLKTDPRVQYPEAALQEGITAMASFPIKCRNVVVGILRIYHSEQIRLHNDDVESILLLCLHLGLVIENSGLKNFLDSVKGAMGNLPLRLLEGL